MNNLKKTVAVVLAVAMVLSMGIATSFAAFSDVPSTVSYAEAVNILNNLGIINGYEDGTFRPDNTITRAEVATMIVKALDLSVTKGPTPFSDVDADHWAAGYINAAYNNNKIIAGMGDGTFRPSANVTYEQVVKMIVAALGYEIAANRQGGYPTGYLAVATQEGITTGAAGSVGQDATRATVARLIYNALEVPKLVSKVYGATGNDYQPDPTKTILSNLGVEKREVVVTSTYLTKGNIDPRDRTVELELNKRYRDTDYPSSEYTGEKGTPLGEFYEGGTAASSLLGYSCVAYIGIDDDTDNPTVFAISAKGTKNSVVTLTKDMLSPEDDDNDPDEYDIYYRDGNRTRTLTPAENVSIFANYDDVTTDKDLSGAKTTTEEYYDYIKDGGVISFIDNDNDNEFEYVMITKYIEEYVIESVEEEDGIWSFECLTKNSMESYDTEDDNLLVLFVKGENYINVSEIAKGDTITKVSNSDDTIVVYYVSSEQIKGSVDSYDPDSQTYKIGNRSGIAVSPLSELDREDIYDIDGTFYLNADGLIAYAEGDVNLSGNYGFVTGAGSDGGFQASQIVQIVGMDGNAVNYTLTRSTRVYASVDGRDKDVVSEHTASGVLDAIEEYVLNDNYENRIVKYSANASRQLTSIYVSDTNNFYVNEIKSDKLYDAAEGTLGAANFTASTVVFSVTGDNDDDYSDSSNVSVGPVSQFFVDDERYGGNGGQIYYYGTDDKTAVVLAFNISTPVVENDNVFIVSNTSTSRRNGDNVLSVSGYKGGKSASFTIYNEDDPGVADAYIDSLVKGTVLLVSGASTITDPVNEIKILVTLPIDTSGRYAVVTGGPELADGVESREYVQSKRKWIAQDVATVTSGKNTNQILVDGYTDNDDYGYYRPADSTVITLVDFSSARLSQASVASGRTASALRYSDRYEGAVYFRVYDADIAGVDDIVSLQGNRAEVTDLVGYRFLKDDHLYNGPSVDAYTYNYEGEEIDEEPVEEEVVDEEPVEEEVEVEDDGHIEITL